MAALVEQLKEFTQQLFLLRQEIRRLHPIYGKWRSEIRIDETIAAGKEIEVMRFEGAGYLSYCLFRTNNKELMLKVDLYSDGLVEIAESLRTLYEKGLTQSIGGFRVLKYSDTESDYIAEYPPGSFSGSGMPFRGYATLRLFNPTTTTVKYSLYAYIIELPLW